jgi:hypothetical protein
MTFPEKQSPAREGRSPDDIGQDVRRSVALAYDIRAVA